eukprot:TRINITY_DN16353_c0_g1_i1.p1 TRINITY_DN16353_c0_g1~~TRINITY_DN16353_c0_g1_i1.p1  ORF type:complete len:151 (-),score=29.80 TRINITY_DN16353_c0_g1_i1:206-619(-)
MASWLRLSRPLLSATKGTTGIVGLEVVPEAREKLIGLYKQTLQAVQVIPDTAVYRQTVEKLTNYRLKVCEEETSTSSLEKKIGSGQVEELIWQAKDELELIPKMAEWKPWEAPEGHKVEIVEDLEPIPKHIPHPIGA